MPKGKQPLPPYVTAKGRDLRIDLLRGYFVFAMVVDHLCGSSPLWLLTGGNRFFAGAAEGFILTSGLVAGLVYGRLIKRDGLGRSLMRVLSRAFALYLLTLALTLALLPLSEVLGLPWAQGVGARDPFSVVVSILTLHRTYYLVDVMLLYTILFLLTPLALVLLDQGRRRWVLGASWLLWGLFQLWPQYSSLPWPITGNYLFSFSAWQVIYFTGLALGYGRKGMPVPRPRTARLLLALTGIALLVMVVLFFLVEPPTTAMTPASTSIAGHDLRALVENLFLDKVDVRPGRLMATGVTFAFLFLAATVFWAPVRRVVGWLLLPLGQHALYAYTAHIGLAAAVALGLAPLTLGGSASQWLNALLQVAGVALIWVLVRFQVLAPTPRTRRYYNLSPILFAVLAGVTLYLSPSLASAGPAEPTAEARLANRFGTPLPPDSAPVAPAPLANRFGTPLPRHAGSAAVGEVTPQPAPTATPVPDERPDEPGNALARVAPWVGAINGTLEEHWFYSPALGREMPYWAYLPPDYYATARGYPVLYLLHGAGGHRDEWICFGAVEVADREMSRDALTPMIIIMPQGDQSFWVDHPDGPRWGDYVCEDLVAEVDGSFRTLAQADARAIGGLSMGGFGALTLGFTHPETFHVVGAHCPSLHVESADLAFLGSGVEYAQRDPLSLAAAAPGLDGLRVWIDIDAEDPWLERAQQLHDSLAGRGVEHQWHVFPGIHEGDYWITHVIDYLRFYNDSLAPGW